MGKKKDCWEKICIECKSPYPNHKVDCQFNPNIARIIGEHKGCGGDIFTKGKHTWCEKCKEYFCGCACG